MFIHTTRHSVLRSRIISIISQFNKRNNSTSTKLTSSYFHHASSLPFIYKTLSQTFDETANRYPNHECYIFKSMFFISYLFFMNIFLGEQKRYTFKSFQDEVDSIAASLLELGFEKNDRFAVWLPNTSENVTMSFVASKLGLIKVKSFFFLANHIFISFQR